jgi:hypothetical protein
LKHSAIKRNSFIDRIGGRWRRSAAAFGKTYGLRQLRILNCRKLIFLFLNSKLLILNFNKGDIYESLG